MNASPVETLAVVVALTDPVADLGGRLARFAEEAGPSGEVLLVDASGSPESARLAGQFANVRVLHRPLGRVAPSLWRDGLLATDADLVAFTTGQMMPTLGWIEALRGRLRETGAAAVGGPIEPGSKLSAADKAVALLRYASYFPNSSPLPLAEGPGVRGAALLDVREDGSNGTHSTGHAPHPRPLSQRERGEKLAVVQPPGDNALYRRDLLMAVDSSWLDGFWETEVHSALRLRGESLVMADGAVVTFNGGVGLASMAAQRFRHARRYAVGRSSGLGKLARWSRVAGSPLVPPLLCWRIFRALWARKMALRPWISALPGLVLLATAWAVGEAVGTWPDDRSKRERMTQPISEVA